MLQSRGLSVATGYFIGAGAGGPRGSPALAAEMGRPRVGWMYTFLNRRFLPTGPVPLPPLVVELS